jgi:predicted nucleic acid-binding protein
VGSLTLPESGRVYVDAQILIYTVERFPQYFDVLLLLWQASKGGQLEVVTSELSILEVMTGPMKTGSQHLIQAYEGLIMGTEIGLIPIDSQVLLDAARLRAETSLRTPDAIHVATAILAGCQTLVTNDLAFRSVSSIDVQILKDIVEA